MAVFGVPDLSQLHNTPTAGTFERIVAKTLFDSLAPFEVVECLDQGLQVEERELEAERFKGSVNGWGESAFDVAGVETGVAHHLHPLRWDVGDHAGDEVEGRTGDGDALK